MNGNRTNEQKIEIFGRHFTGLTQAYGTYYVNTGKAKQVKRPVTKRVLLDHLVGRQPYGVYLLVKDRVRALAVDFDDGDLTTAMDYVAAARNYSLDFHIERSKSKGHHAWMLFCEDGAVAAKARVVARLVLGDIDRLDAEVFPKQDRLGAGARYGNFINAPLFGRLVLDGRTVFLDPDNGMKPYGNQWDFLDSVTPTPESLLDEIITINELAAKAKEHGKAGASNQDADRTRTFGLPPCATAMLEQGVTKNQRVSCFNLAIQLKKAGMPHDLALVTLQAWANKNKPQNGKRIITVKEIDDQAAAAFNKPYFGCGCNDAAVRPFCDSQCALYLAREREPKRTPSTDEVS